MEICEESFSSRRHKKNKNRNGISVEVKPKLRAGKCVGLASQPENVNVSSNTITTETTAFIIISNDIWYHIVNYIPPEEVQTFALICRQTAALVRTRTFWWKLYNRYCQVRPGHWNLSLPDHLQYDILREYEMSQLRFHVIQALFLSYKPLVDRIKHGYTMDSLVGRIYTASWAIRGPCEWIMCYKLYKKDVNICIQSTSTQCSLSNIHKTEVSDWELLVDESNISHQLVMNSYVEKTLQDSNPNEGVKLLLVICERFVPFPTELLYGLESNCTRFAASRQMLSKNMRSSDLELDFINGSQKAISTIKYPNIRKCIVLPWWHPDFRKFIR